MCFLVDSQSLVTMIFEKKKSSQHEEKRKENDSLEKFKPFTYFFLAEQFYI